MQYKIILNIFLFVFASSLSWSASPERNTHALTFHVPGTALQIPYSPAEANETKRFFYHWLWEENSPTDDGDLKPQGLFWKENLEMIIKTKSDHDDELIERRILPRLFAEIPFAVENFQKYCQRQKQKVLLEQTATSD